MSRDASLERPGVDFDQEEQEEHQPWYRDYANSHPFKLVRKIFSKDSNAPTLRSLALFPWDNDSLSTLWKGTQHTVEYLEQWKQLISEYWDAVAVGSDLKLYLFFTNQKRAPLCVKLPPPDESEEKLLEADKMCVAWALSYAAPFEPLVIFSRGSLLYIYNVVRKDFSGYIQGHGGAITSISVHPSMVHLFCTTSRDYTTRIYDLAQASQRVPNNPHWPPSKNPSLAGPAHGLHMVEPEGLGIGRCIIVLMGGRSGGHTAEVLASAFHPQLPLIATCGMDRAVKIWAVRPTSNIHMGREDKPLFSSGRIHTARVLSISWLQHDLLLTHSAPAIMRTSPSDIDDKTTYNEAGQLIIWRWLGVDRFFPPGQEEVKPTTIRGCSSDCQESSSFKLISINAFPVTPSQYQVFNISLFQSPTHDPLVLSVYPGTKSFSISNASLLRPRQPPPFPLEDLKRLKMARRHLHDGDEGGNLADAAEEIGSEINARDGEWNEATGGNNGTLPPPEITGWVIGTEDTEDVGGELMNCAMGLGGRVIVGVGTKGSLWVWRYDE